MKRLFITAIVALGLLYSGPALAATTLSDAELAGVSGGGIDPHLEGQSLPQEQQQPEKNNTGYAPLRQPQSIDGMELTPELFAVLQSTIDAKRKRELLLNGTSQQNAIALSLENALASDIILSNNIFDGNSISLDDVTTEVEINQINNLSQRHRAQGNLTSSIASHRYEKSELRRSGSESYEYHAYSSVDQSRINEYRSTYLRDNTVKVGKTFNSLGEMVPDIITPSDKKWLDILNLQVDELNYGAGLDIKGGGTVDASVLHFGLDADADIDLCIFGWCFATIHIDVIDVDKDLKVLDSVVIVPGDPNDTPVETETYDDDLVEEYKAIDVAETTFNESYEHSVFTGGQMAGAEAELLAMSDGSLSVDNNSTVALSDNTQQNMRILHGVNAVSSVAANGLNISRTSSFSARPTGVPQLSLQQHNRFNQEM